MQAGYSGVLVLSDNQEEADSILAAIEAAAGGLVLPPGARIQFDGIWSRSVRGGEEQDALVRMVHNIAERVKVKLVEWAYVAGKEAA